MAGVSPRKNQLRQAILHKKESSGSKPLSQDASWMLDQCDNCSGDPGEGRFSSLPQDTKGTRAPDTQNYTQWKVAYGFHKISHPLKTRRNTIILQPLSYTSPDYPVAVIEPQVMNHVHNFCQAFFHGVEIVLAEPLDLLTAKRLTRRVHHETKREQILVGSILRLLRKQKYPAKAFCVIGVTIVDLYPSAEWNFTLGQAYFSEGIAVCSFGRYFNSQPSSACSTLQHQMSNLWILVRVLTHELCHLYGLTHCFYFSCAMNESNSIAEAATQPLFLCPICLRKLHKVIKFNVRDRYHHMAEQCRLLSRILRSYETQSTRMTVLDGITDEGEIVTSVEVNHTNKDRDTVPSSSTGHDLSDSTSTHEQQRNSAVVAVEQDTDAVMSPNSEQAHSNSVLTQRQSSSSAVDTEDSSLAQQDKDVLLSPFTEQDLSNTSPSQTQSISRNSSTAQQLDKPIITSTEHQSNGASTQQQDRNVVTSPPSTELQSNSLPAQSSNSLEENSSTAQPNDSQQNELASALPSARFASALEWLQSSIASLDEHNQTTKLT